MKVTAHGPHVWFLLQDAARHYLSARVSRSATEYELLVQLTPEEYAEYLALGRVYLDYLAARIDNRAAEYAARDVSREWREKVAQAIREWRATGT